jgi:Protein of unknown function (DUF1153)
MDESATKRVSQVVGPEGLVLTLAKICHLQTRDGFLDAREKLSLPCSAVSSPLAEACERYAISTDEFMECERSYEQGGLLKLRRARPTIQNW